MAAYHVAQFNVARMVAPLDDPQMQGFVIRLDAINALAERSPGFVWRHQGENGNSTGERPYDDATLINLSVWETPAQWQAYVFRGAHREVMKRRGAWFERHDGTPYSVMWWVPAGHLPTVAEAVARLEHLRAHGPSEWAFAPLKPYPAPSDQ